MLSKLEKKYGEDFSWYMLEKYNKQKNAIENRLGKELVPEHDLYQIKDNLFAIAQNERNDDILFSDGSRFYVIHLTWSEGNKEYPQYIVVEPSELLKYLEDDYLQG